MGYFLDNYDFTHHNEQVKRVWDSYRAGSPVRTPVILGINPRIYLLNPALNADGVSFADYFADPDTMVDIQLKSQDYIRHNFLQDAPMGMPEDGWRINIDLQNIFEAGWLGAKVEFRDGQVPDAQPFLHDSNKRELFDRGIPDPFSGGIMAKNWAFYEHIMANIAKYVYKGLPLLGVNPSGNGTDGPMTVASDIRGASEFCLEMYEDPDYAHQLLEFVTEAAIVRIKAYRKALGQDEIQPAFFFADDSIELLSIDTYKEFVLPCHRRLINELAEDGPHGIHLCGNVQRFWPLLRDELNIKSWDAGFPVDYGAARETLGEDFEIATGPTVALMLSGSPQDIKNKTREILGSGICAGGKFILREANNLAPLTPVENVKAMYDTAAEWSVDKG